MDKNILATAICEHCGNGIHYVGGEWKHDDSPIPKRGTTKLATRSYNRHAGFSNKIIKMVDNDEDHLRMALMVSDYMTLTLQYPEIPKDSIHGLVNKLHGDFEHVYQELYPEYTVPEIIFRIRRVKFLKATGDVMFFRVSERLHDYLFNQPITPIIMSDESIPSEIKEEKTMIENTGVKPPEEKPVLPEKNDNGPKKSNGKKADAKPKVLACPNCSQVPTDSDIQSTRSHRKYFVKNYKCPKCGQKFLGYFKDNVFKFIVKQGKEPKPKVETSEN